MAQRSGIDVCFAMAEDMPYKYVHLRNFDEHSLRLLFEVVFKCNVMEITPGGHAPIRHSLKWTLHIPRFNTVLSGLLAIIRIIHVPLHRALLAALYYPYAINMAVKRENGLP